MPGTAISPRAFAARVTFWIDYYGETVRIYAPARTVAGTKDSTPDDAELVGTTKALWERGQAATDMATALGVDPRQSIVAFFPKSADAMIVDRRWVVDAAGRVWLINCDPNPQPLGPVPTTIGVGTVLTLVVDRPPGIP